MQPFTTTFPLSSSPALRREARIQSRSSGNSRSQLSILIFYYKQAQGQSCRVHRVAIGVSGPRSGSRWIEYRSITTWSTMSSTCTHTHIDTMFQIMCYAQVQLGRARLALGASRERMLQHACEGDQAACSARPTPTLCARARAHAHTRTPTPGVRWAAGARAPRNSHPRVEAW